MTRLLCFGDSMTEGLVSTGMGLITEAIGPDAYPTVLQGLLSTTYPSQRFAVTNAGKAGEWATDARPRLVNALRAGQFEVVVIIEGANDLNGLGRKGIQPTLDALEDMLRTVRSSGLRAFLGSLPPERPGSRAGGASDLIPEFNAGVRKVADGQRQYFVDVNAAFRNDLSLIGSDGLHPTPAGYARIAQAVFDALHANLELKAAAPTE